MAGDIAETTISRAPLADVTLTDGERVLAIPRHNTEWQRSDLRIGEIIMV